VTDEFGAVGEVIVDMVNLRTWREPATLPFRPSQIPYGLIWNRTWVVAVESRLITARAMARSVGGVCRPRKDCPVLPLDSCLVLACDTGLDTRQEEYRLAVT
jgi:hypothetical protein